MVYRGKRVAKCAGCVQRRIRCDLQDGGCGQCRRIGIVCAGYPDGADLIMPGYLLQTKESMQRHGGRAVALDVHRRPFEAPTSPARTLSQNLDDVAVAYCYHHYFLSHGPSVSSESLLACMKALGMASYSFTYHSAALQKSAYDFYAEALRQVNAILQSPAAVSDDILLSVMTLSCFESVAGSTLSRNALSEWSAHAKGMAAIIRLRGRDQFVSPTGQILFLQACGFILSDCVRSGGIVPKAICELLCLLSHYDVRWRVMPLSASAANLKAVVGRKMLTDPVEIIQRAEQLDRDFDCAYEGTNIPRFEYQIYTLATSPGSQLPSYIYSYQTVTAAIMFNTMRTGRLLCQGIIADTLRKSSIDRDLQLRLQEVSYTVRMLQLDILASVPQFLYMAGVDSWDAVNLILSQTFSESGTRPMFSRDDLPPTTLPILQIGRNYNLVFNLALVGRLAEAGSDIRKAVCRTLDYIGRNFRLSLALHFKNVLEENLLPSSIIEHPREGNIWSPGTVSHEQTGSDEVADMYQKLSC